MINYFNKPRDIIMSLSLASMLMSCNLDEVPDLDNVYLPKYEGGIAVLIVNDTITFGDFIEETIQDSTKYTIDSNQRILFSYMIEQDFDAGEDFVKIDDISNSEYIESPISEQLTLLEDRVIPIKKTVDFKFPSTGDERLDSAYYSSGSFNFTLNTNFPDLVRYQFSTAAFTKISEGDSIVINSTLTKPSGAPAVIGEHSIGLEGYKTNLRSESGVNQFSVTIDATVELKAGTELTGNEYINIDLLIKDPTFDVVFGYFQKDTFNIKENKIDLDFFKDLGGEGIEFEAPQIAFEVNNGFGIPFAVDFTNVYATYEDGADLYFDDGNGGPLVLSFDSPDLSDWGSAANSVQLLNNSNSNFQEILRGSPSQLVMPLKGYTNVGDEDANFLTTDSRIDITAKVSIPLSLKVSGFEYEKTEEMDGLSDLEGTKEISLLINTVNELPFTGTLDLYMLDKDGVELGSLLDQSLFTTPTSYDSQGKVSAPSQNTSVIVLNQELVDALVNSTDLKFVIKITSFDSSNDNFVEVFADYDLILKIGLSGDVSLDLNGN